MPAHYIIDGYNVVHKSKRLRKKVHGDLEGAREALIDKVVTFCAAGGQHCTIVFDGRGQHRGESVPHHRGVQGLEVVYSPDHLTADACIERMTYESKDRMNVVVVTNDHGIRDIVRGMGALTMDADNFLSTVQERRVDIDHKMARTGREKIEHLEDRLDDSSMDTLKKLRDEL